MYIIQTIVVLILIILIVNFIIIITHKLTIARGLIKYNMTRSDKYLINRYSKEISIKDLDIKTKCVFYTEVPWKSSTGNYIHSKERYYIIEPGYYYYLEPEDELVIITGDSPIKVLTDNSKINFV